ncbi:MAG TPA: thrombospondin type 3 repeat-containing protein [Dehalococcoidia bacterium]|nr:thrombospondin type 3 repeat-containing protein [Dehalococcoidia bacterium]
MRHKLVVLSLVVLAMAFGGSTAVAQAAGLSPGERAQRFEYPGVDNVSVVSQTCQADGTVLIQVNWTTYNLGYQWTDLSLHNNGWIWGTFVGVGPALPSATSQPWGGLLPGYWHYLRVNTLTPFGWWPSPTIAFFTRNDCFVQDSDGDGVPNNVDYCPNQFGSPAYGGCPIPTPPPPTTARCEQPNGTGWCPGQPAPQQHCPAQAQILIFPPPPAGCVWVTKGENSNYVVGEQITICYWVNQPNVYVQVTTQRPDGTFVNAFEPGYDDGRGNCVLGTAGTPAGQRTTRLYTLNSQVLDTTVWNVQ